MNYENKLRLFEPCQGLDDTNVCISYGRKMHKINDFHIFYTLMVNIGTETGLCETWCVKKLLTISWAID